MAIDSPASNADTQEIKTIGDAAAVLQKAHKILAGKDDYDSNAVFYGAQDLVKKSLVTIAARGHVLLSAVQGTGKTELSQTLGKILDLEESRIQFTADMLPGDITGSDMLFDVPETGGQELRFVPGPVFTELLLADEINRASPKVQSALFQAMQEKSVTINGKTHQLSDEFTVVATMNPSSQKGTYALPEAQLDRFAVGLRAGSSDEEIGYLISIDQRNRKKLIDSLRPLMSKGAGDQEHDLQKIERLVKQVSASEEVAKFANRIAHGARLIDTAEPKDYIKDNFKASAEGARPGRTLLRLAKANALFEGRSAATLEDVAEYAIPVLKHRMEPKGAEAKANHEDLILRLVNDCRP